MNFRGPQSVASDIISGKADFSKTIVMVNPLQVYQKEFAAGSSEDKPNNDLFYMASIGKILASKDSLRIFQRKAK